jgi:hypothetical protein
VGFPTLLKQVGGVPERLGEAADAVRRQRPRKRRGVRRLLVPATGPSFSAVAKNGAWWLLLLAVGAALYALAKRSGMPEPARGIARQAKEHAPAIPYVDLLDRVKDVVGVAADDRKADRRKNRQRPAASASRDSAPNSDQLTRNLQNRAERRRRRREVGSQ